MNEKVSSEEGAPAWLFVMLSLTGIPFRSPYKHKTRCRDSGFCVFRFWVSDKWERYFSYMRTPKVMRQKEEGIICRLMARSGRLPSGFDYTLIKIIINIKLIRNRKFNIIDWKIIRFNGYCWQSWKEIEEDKPVSVWSIAIRKWSLSDKWGIRAG